MENNDKHAYTIQLEAIIESFPGVKPREVMVFDSEIMSTTVECYADEKIMKLRSTLMKDEERLRLAITHCLIHYQTNDPGHGEAFLKQEAERGLTEKSKDLLCYASKPKEPEQQPKLDPNSLSITECLRLVITNHLQDLKIMDVNPTVKWKISELNLSWQQLEAALDSKELPAVGPLEKPARQIQRCPKCSSKMTYLRISVDEFICRSCGTTWPLKTKVLVPQIA